MSRVYFPLYSRVALLCVVPFVAGCDDDGLQHHEHQVAHSSLRLPGAAPAQTPEAQFEADAGPTLESDYDAAGDIGTMPQDTSTPAADIGPPPPEGTGEGWVGDPCETDADCGYPDALCLSDEAGFPDGLCTQRCELYCPDREGATTTFCVEGGALGLDSDSGWCVSRCLFGPEQPHGCRESYGCQELPRNSEPTTTQHACVPGADEGITLSPCRQALVDRGMVFELAANPGNHPAGMPELTCNVEEPVRVWPEMYGVTWRYGDPSQAAKPIFASCPLAASLDDTAALLSGQDIRDIIHWGVYNCRVISGTTKLSQHGLANAVDIAMVRFQDGVVVTVLDDWELGVALPVTHGGNFLRWMAESFFSEAIYNIILTPEYNAGHRDHFHCDLTPDASSLH